MATDPFISVQDLIDISGRGGTADPGMLIAVDAACDTVRALSEQQFNRGTTTFTLDGTGTDAMLLPQLPVNSVSSVVINGGTVTDYTLNGNGILFRGTAGVDPRPVWPSGRQNVVVTADHGYATVDIPRDVRKVALNLAYRSVLQGPAIEESLGSNRIKYAAPAGDLTIGEMAILAKYRRIR